MLGDTSFYQNLRGKTSLELVPAAITDIGCEREINEDRYAVIDGAAGRAWIVCDGMGGTLGGELAAQLAIDAMRRALQTGDEVEPQDALHAAIEEANRVIVLRRQNPAFSGMGTTVIGALIQDKQVVIAHAGDSRAYLVREQSIQQLTIDHTYVQDLVERGVISQEEAMSHPQAHVLTRCLGAEPRLSLDRLSYWLWDVTEGEISDSLVLCSDGLYSLVADNEIAEAVSKLSPQDACAQLVELAKSRGGYDNITVAVLPLEGQLREEAPENAIGQRRRRAVPEAEGSNQPIAWGSLLAIGFFLALIGSVITTLVVMWQMST